MAQLISAPQTPTENFEALQPEASAPHKVHKTLGTRIHWALTYLGGDWLLNSSFGVAFAFFAARTHVGQKYYYEPVTNFFTSIAKPFIKNEKTLKQAVGGGTSFLNIMFGGTVVNPVLTYLESHERKKSISKSIDSFVYGKDRVENDPAFQQAYEDIDNQPKRDTKSVWAARFIALAPLIAASSMPKVNEFFKTTKLPAIGIISHDRISNFSMKVAEKLKIRPRGYMNEMGISSITKQPNTHWQALHEYIGFDFGYTVYYALLHAAAVKGMARMFQTQRDHRQERREAKAHQLAAPQHDETAAPAPEPAATSDTPSTLIRDAVPEEARLQAATPQQNAALA